MIVQDFEKRRGSCLRDRYSPYWSDENFPYDCEGLCEGANPGDGSGLAPTAPELIKQRILETGSIQVSPRDMGRGKLHRL